MIAFDLRHAIRGGVVSGLLGLASGPLMAQESDASLRLSIAREVGQSRALSSFYADRDYDPIWIGDDADDARRREALLNVLAQAGDHALPQERYKQDLIASQLRTARTPSQLAKLEAQMSASFLAYARDVQSGVLVPTRVHPGIKREAPRRNPIKTLAAFEQSAPQAFLDRLPPQTAEYARLMHAKFEMEETVARGGWGPSVEAEKLEAGGSGPEVQALKTKLATLGYLHRADGDRFDGATRDAVVAFQADHGLAQDGVVGPGTLAELNRTAEERLQQIIVAMERERWLNRPLGQRHIRVNLTDFTAKIIDNGKVTFETRSVIGKSRLDHQSPEFSDVMEFMVVNPTWNVPRSITTKEYLPQLQRNPNAVSHLQLIDNNGQPVSRQAVNFRAYNARNFPFRLKEPPSQGNALGLVKFMFPNKYNIYLHDTPSKSLFARETRAYSHGCIRLGDPFDFAYALLAAQTDDPQGVFKQRLNTGRESTIMLETPVPVHLIYRTAFTQPEGRTQFRRDVYERDARVFRALEIAGVTTLSADG